MDNLNKENYNIPQKNDEKMQKKTKEQEKVMVNARRKLEKQQTEKLRKKVKYERLKRERFLTQIKEQEKIRIKKAVSKNIGIILRNEEDKNDKNTTTSCKENRTNIIKGVLREELEKGIESKERQKNQDLPKNNISQEIEQMNYKDNTDKKESKKKNQVMDGYKRVIDFYEENRKFDPNEAVNKNKKESKKNKINDFKIKLKNNLKTNEQTKERVNKKNKEERDDDLYL